MSFDERVLASCRKKGTSKLRLRMVEIRAIAEW
jgi:hypothetical protein